MVSSPSQYKGQIWSSGVSVSLTQFILCVELTEAHNQQLPQLHILPGPLDILKAKDALSKTLAYCPHASGVLRRNGDKWWVSTMDSDFSYIA